MNNKQTESIDFYRIRIPLAIMILLFTLSFSFAHSIHASPKTHHEKNIEKLREDIQKLQQDLANKEIFRHEAADVLQLSERAISHIKRELAQLAQEEKEINQNIDQLQTRSRQIDTSIVKTQQQVGQLLYQHYLNGSQEHLKLLFNQQGANQIARQLYYLQILSHERSKHINVLNTQLEELEILTHITLEKKKEIAVIQSKQFLQKKQLEQENFQRNRLLSEITEQITEQNLQLTKLKRDEERLSALARQIDKLATEKNTTTLRYNNKLPDASNQGQPFNSLKGQLNLPVRGELVSHFGSLRSGKHITWNGLFIRSSKGNKIKVIASGQVVFSDWLRGFGNLIIIDHGNNYMSLYGYNETIYQQVGETVQGGDTIATVGNSGGNLDFGLYFELRHKSKPFDPLTWIKVE